MQGKALTIYIPQEYTETVKPYGNDDGYFDKEVYQ
jgi:hypothetical protein